jgi:acyl carrier protein
MNRDQVRAVVLKYIAALVEGLQASAVDTSLSMRDYHVNSLDTVEVVSRCMRELKVKVPRAELRKLTNIDGLIDLLYLVVSAAGLSACPPAVVADQPAATESRP